MASFSYECLNRQGQTVKGQISSENIPQAVDKLRSMGLSIVELKRLRSRKSSFLSMEKKVTLGDLTLFSRQLSAMISSGIPVTKSY